MDDESGPIEAKEVFDQGEEPGNNTDATETGQTANSVSAEEPEDYSLISEDDNPSEDSQATLEVEVVLRDEELMVFGDELAVRDFIDSLDISDKKSTKIDNSLFRDLNDQLKKSGTVLQGVSDFAENSGYYIKLTKETLEGIKEFGLADTYVPGIKQVVRPMLLQLIIAYV